MLFCPVRAIKWYLSKTEEYHPNCSVLFTPHGLVKKIFRNTVPFWLVLLSVRHIKKPLMVTAWLRKFRHIKSAVSELAAFKQNFTVQQIVRARRWALQTMFTTSYVKAPIDVQADVSGSVLIPVSVLPTHIVSFQLFQVVVQCGHGVSAEWRGN